MQLEVTRCQAETISVKLLVIFGRIGNIRDRRDANGIQAGTAAALDENLEPKSEVNQRSCNDRVIRLSPKSCISEGIVIGRNPTEHVKPIGPGRMGRKQNSGNSAAFFRIGSVVQICEVIAELGLDVTEALGRAGMSQELFADQETLLPLEMIDGLIHDIETRTGCDHIGMLMGRLPGNLGLPEFLLRAAPSPQHGLVDFIGFMNSLPRAGGVYLNVVGEEATFGYVPVAARLRTAHHIADFGVCQPVRMLRDCLGADFKPVRVNLPRRTPSNTAPYRNFFGILPKFNATETSLTFHAGLLEKPSMHANPQLHALLKKYVPKEIGLATQIGRMLPLLIYRGDISRAAIAEAMNMPPRTLHRRLAADGTNYRSILGSVRSEIGRHLIENTDLTISAIASYLLYSDLPAFSREFAKAHGAPPLTWRKSSLDERAKARTLLGSAPG
mgnify:FL=1